MRARDVAGWAVIAGVVAIGAVIVMPLIRAAKFVGTAIDEVAEVAGAAAQTIKQYPMLAARLATTWFSKCSFKPRPDAFDEYKTPDAVMSGFKVCKVSSRMAYMMASWVVLTDALPAVQGRPIETVAAVIIRDAKVAALAPHWRTQLAEAVAHWHTPSKAASALYYQLHEHYKCTSAPKDKQQRWRNVSNLVITYLYSKAGYGQVSIVAGVKC